MREREEREREGERSDSIKLTSKERWYPKMTLYISEILNDAISNVVTNFSSFRASGKYSQSTWI